MLDERPENAGPFTGVWACLATPRAYFAAMPRDKGYGAPVARILFWSAASALFGLLLKESTALEAVAGRPGAGLAWLAQGAAYQCGASFISAGVFHLICRALGGGAPYQASFRAVAALSVLGPAAELAGLVPFFGIAFLCAAALAYWALAAIEVQGVPPRRAWAAFGALAALFVSLACWISLL